MYARDIRVTLNIIIKMWEKFLRSIKWALVCFKLIVLSCSAWAVKVCNKKKAQLTAQGFR